jgi:hypothetical protein
MSPLKISYHHISSATVSIKYVQAVCYQDSLLDIVGMELPFKAPYNPRREEVSKHVQFQRVFLSGECQMVEYKCVL